MKLLTKLSVLLVILHCIQISFGYQSLNVRRSRLIQMETSTSIEKDFREIINTNIKKNIRRRSNSTNNKTKTKKSNKKSKKKIQKKTSKKK